MSGARCLLCPAVLAAIVAGCSVEPTRIVVVTQTDLAVPAELDALTIEVDATAIGGSQQVRMTPLDGDRVAPPIVLAIVHDGGELGPITVRVWGFHEGEVVVERAARLSFVPGRSVLLRVDLVRACRDHDCEGGRSCEAGACVPLDVDAQSLPTWAGREGLPTLPRDPGDAGASADAWVAPDDAWAPPDDAAVAPDGGAACAAGCECAQTCIDDEGCECRSGCACALACVPGDDCTHVLCDGEGTTCAIDGSGVSNLEARCDHRSSCTIDARDASNALALSCRDSSRCEVDCRGASNCALRCESGSQCVLRCGFDSSCDLECTSGDRRVCADGVLACNRGCP